MGFALEDNSRFPGKENSESGFTVRGGAGSMAGRWAIPPRWRQGEWGRVNRTADPSFAIRDRSAASAAVLLACALALGLSPMAVAGAEPVPVAVSVAAAGPSTVQPGDSLELMVARLPHSVVAADIKVSFTPAGGKTAAQVKATVAQDKGNGAYLVKLTLPEALRAAEQRSYLISVSGTDSAGTSFASSSPAQIRVNPVASIAVVSDSHGRAGQVAAVRIEGTFTKFAAGGTQASFGAGVSVGGAVAGAPGPVTVLSETEAEASLRIAPNAAPGARDVTVKTGGRASIARAAFVIEPELRLPALRMP